MLWIFIKIASLGQYNECPQHVLVDVQVIMSNYNDYFLWWIWLLSL